MNDARAGNGERRTSTPASDRDLRGVLEGAHVAYIAMDAGGFIIDWNAEAETTFGWSRKEAVGRVLADTIIPERHREAHLRGLERYLATGEGPVVGKRFEIDALHREGFEFPVELIITARTTEDSYYFNALLHDISDRRRIALYVDAQHAVTRILAGASTDDEVILGLLPELGDRLRWDYGAFWRMDRDSGRLRCSKTWTAADDPSLLRFASVSRELTLERGEGLPGRVWESGQPALLQDVAKDDNFPRAKPAAEAGLHAAICFPLIKSDSCLGVVEFLSTAIGKPDDRLLETIATIGFQVGHHLEVVRERTELIARMEQLALTDELTGLPNRRAWGDELERELARSKRHSERLSVAMIDLDHFKKYNDTHGHPAGDRLLEAVGAAWKEAIRGSDFLARYGGEEFAVLLPGCPPASAPDVVDRVRAATPSGQTCSAGIAAWDGEESARSLVARADAALYEAKRAGRDRTIDAEKLEGGA